MTPAENINIGQVVLQWGPWVIASGVGIMIAFVNTKMENLREVVNNHDKMLRERMTGFVETLATQRECSRHLEQTLERLNAELQEWEKLDAVSHEKIASGVAANKTGCELLVTMVRDIGLDLKSIGPRLSILETRVQNLEVKR